MPFFQLRKDSGNFLVRIDLVVLMTEHLKLAMPVRTVLYFKALNEIDNPRDVEYHDHQNEKNHKNIYYPISNHIHHLPYSYNFVMLRITHLSSAHKISLMIF